MSVNYEFWPKEDGQASKDKAIFDQFASHREAIEQELGQPLLWDRGDDKGYSMARLLHDGDYRDESQQPDLVQWLVDTAAAFFRVLPKYDDAPR